ncbi:MAG: NADH-quinone oxidoreductase subunit C [Zoogloeaceae bacterium]|jgi:NADH-quinone oxidoreductase subunit C|nr:NADH-quinone oxidoreductase subunit C [Zoogloeaceae bacterium]
MSAKLETLKTVLTQQLAGRIQSLTLALDELSLEVAAADYESVMRDLRDAPELGFEQLIDLCGVDYSEYRENWTGRRFAVVAHLLSLAHNWRLRVRVFALNDDFPLLPSLTSLWASANWYEREAFDLLGVVFEGHEDLRRILTDYGFVGHPLRKDFPLAGHVEMRYDEQAGRVVYQPVSITPRETAPRIRRNTRHAACDGDLEHG